MGIKKTLLFLFLFAMTILICVGLFSAITYKKLKDEKLYTSEKHAYMESLALETQVHFKKQVQEWKNILLRGTDDALYEKYLKQFLQEEKATQVHLKLLLSKLSPGSNSEKVAKEFGAAHDELGIRYREALPAFKITEHEPHITVDKYVRGIDRQPTDLIDHLTSLMAANKQQALDDLKDEIATKLQSLSIIIVLLILGLILVTAVALNRIVIKPLITATNIATEISSGKYSNLIQYGNLSNESNRLLYALNSMQTTIADSAIQIANNNKILRNALHDAHESERIRSDFIANLNHELITPMTGVLGMIDLLADTKLNPDQAEYVSLAKESGNRFLTTVNGVIDLSNIENDRFVISEDLFNLKECLYEISEHYTQRISTTSLNFRASIPEHIPLWVYGDRQCLQHTIKILLDNAIKFTSDGEIRLNAVVQVLNQEQALIKFEVIDTGVGISPKELENIFDSFRQEDSSLSRNHEGLGVGLSIFRKIVELMGGEIAVDSTLGKGSTFSFNTPFAIASAEAIQKTEEAHLI